MSDFLRRLKRDMHDQRLHFDIRHQALLDFLKWQSNKKKLRNLSYKK